MSPMMVSEDLSMLRAGYQRTSSLGNEARPLDRPANHVRSNGNR